jgi:hypothetical protein
MHLCCVASSVLSGHGWLWECLALVLGAVPESNLPIYRSLRFCTFIIVSSCSCLRSICALTLRVTVAGLDSRAGREVEACCSSGAVNCSCLRSLTLTLWIEPSGLKGI